MREHCKTCVFWHAIPYCGTGNSHVRIQQEVQGWCKRYPTALLKEADDFCGEHRGQSDVQSTMTMDRGTPASMQSKASTEWQKLVKDVCAAIEQRTRLGG